MKLKKDIMKIGGDSYIDDLWDKLKTKKLF